MNQIHTSDACFGCGTPWKTAGKITAGKWRAPGVLGEKVKPDEIVICKNCGAVMKLDQDLRLRTLTDQEHRAVESNAPLMAAIAAMLLGANISKHLFN